MLPFLDKDKAVAGIVESIDDEGKLEREEDDREENVENARVSEQGLRVAAGDLMNAFESGDESRFMSALKAFIDMHMDSR